MKKVIYMSMVFLVVTGLSLRILASTQPLEKHAFKSTEREINFDIERKQGEVALYFQSTVFSSYDQIIVEKSGAGNSNSYTVCKTIDLASTKIIGDYYVTSDKFPISAKIDSYYRIKTVSKDGSVKVFPPVQLEALTR